MTYDPLFELQDLDVQVDDLNASIRGHKQEAVEAAGKLEVLNKSVAEKTKAHQDAQIKVRKLEKEIEAQTASLKQGEQKMMQVTSTKQMEAMQHQKEATSAKKDSLEEELLTAYGELEELDAALSDLTSRAERQKERKERLAQEARQAIQNLEGQIRDLSTRRPSVASTVDAGELSRYQDLRNQYGGKVLFGVEDSGCPGCGLSQSAVTFQRLRAGGKATPCENCGRLLVYEGITD